MHTFGKENLPEEVVSATYKNKKTEKKSKLLFKHNAKYYQRVISVAAIILCCAFIFWGGLSLFYQGANAYGITVNGNTVAVLTSQQDAQAALDTYLQQKSELRGCPVLCAEDVTVDAISARGHACVTTQEAIDILNESLTEIVNATIINVDGREIAALSSEEAAQEAMECAKAYYLKDGERIIDSDIKEDITFIHQWRDPETLVLPEIAASQLLFGVPQLITHVVESEDETLWTIARQYDVPIEQIQEANTGLKSEDIVLGQTVKISTPQPEINVIVVKEVIKTAEIPFKVDTKNNSSMLRGTQKTVSEGKKGIEEVTLRVVENNGLEVSRERASAVVLTAPVNKVVERGTKMVVASRGSGAAGTVGWPLIGQLTSYFGPRGSGYHTGLDINGNTGDRVVAAEGGKIIFTGYSGGYGNLIKIDHGDGLQTWYAHLSKYGIKVGDSVERGQYIGNVGNTGRSTGSHLHFEVRINGTAYNPLKYLR